MSVRLSENVQLESGNYKGTAASATDVTPQRQRGIGATLKKCAVVKISTLKHGPPESTEKLRRNTKVLHKSKLNDEFLLQYNKRTINAEKAQPVLDDDKSQFFSFKKPQIPPLIAHRRRPKPKILSVGTFLAPKLDSVQIGQSKQATTLNNTACELQRKLDEMKAIYFRDDKTQYSLPYSLRFCRGKKRYVLAAIMTMAKDEFKLCTHIHNLPSAYDDGDLLKRCYEFTMQEPKVWPRNLFISIVDLCRFLTSRGIIFNSSTLSAISPKLLHWSDMVTTTNYDDCVRLDYFRTTGEKLPEELLEERRRSYYNKCWLHDDWIRLKPRINADTQMTIKKTIMEVIPKSGMYVGKKSEPIVININIPSEENKEVGSDLQTTYISKNGNFEITDILNILENERRLETQLQRRIIEPHQQDSTTLGKNVMPQQQDTTPEDKELTQQQQSNALQEATSQLNRSRMVQQLPQTTKLNELVSSSLHKDSTTIGLDIEPQQQETPPQDKKVTPQIQRNAIQKATSVRKSESTRSVERAEILQIGQIGNKQLNPNLAESNLPSLAPPMNDLRRRQKMKDRIVKLLTRFEGKTGSPLVTAVVNEFMKEDVGHVQVQNLQFNLTGENVEVNCEGDNSDLVAVEDSPSKESTFLLLSSKEEICAPTSTNLQAEKRAKQLQAATPNSSKGFKAKIALPSTTALVNNSIKKEKDIVPLRNLQYGLTGDDGEVDCEHVNFDLVVVEDSSSQESTFELLSLTEEISAPTSPILQAEESDEVQNTFFVQPLPEKKEAVQDKKAKINQRSDKVILKAIAAGHVNTRTPPTNMISGESTQCSSVQLHKSVAHALSDDEGDTTLFNSTRFELFKKMYAQVNVGYPGWSRPRAHPKKNPVKPQSQSLAHALSGDTTLFNSTRPLQIVNEQHQQPSQCHEVGSQGEQHEQ